MATSRWWTGGDLGPAAKTLPSPDPAPRFLVAAAASARTVANAARAETLKDGIWWIPVRAFIGIGWLRAFAEKAVEPDWRDGTRLAAFLEHQQQAGLAGFSPYQALLSDVFLAHALILGWIVTIGQLLAGLAILTGCLTRVALLGGIFMNLNFLLAGVPDPSAFYIVIQASLLLAGAGSVFGVEARIAARRRLAFLAACPQTPRTPISTPTAVALAALACGVAAYATAHVRDWTPAGSVHDPAAVLAVLASMAAAWLVIAALRRDPRAPARSPQPAFPHDASRTRGGAR